MSDHREAIAEHFRREMNGIWFEEIEEEHRRRGLDPMTCNDSICLRAVERADALLGSDILAQIRAEAERLAQAKGIEAGYAKGRQDGAAEARADHLTPDEIAVLLAEARAEAWDEGYTAGSDDESDPWPHHPPTANPYRAEGSE